MSEYLRLAFGTVVVLAPGWLVARALGQRGAAPTLAWGLAAIVVAWTVTFVVHGSIWIALVVLLAIGAARPAGGAPSVLAAAPGGAGRARRRRRARDAALARVRRRHG